MPARGVPRETTSKGVTVGSVNWKWMLIGAAVGYFGAGYLPKLINRG